MNVSKAPGIPQAQSAHSRVNETLWFNGLTPLRATGAGLFLIALAACFGPSLVRLMVYAAGTTLHSHIVLIPLISAYLIFIKRRQLPAAGHSSPVLAALLWLPGAASFALARFGVGAALSLNDGLALTTFSFLCFLYGGGFLFWGRRWMAAVAFPAAFLLFMIPLPDAAVDFLETVSKIGSAEVAAVFFSVTGTPVLRDGFFFQLPGIVLEVAQECSGIRSSWVLFITSLVASHLFLRTPWRRAVLVAFVIPLGLIRNGFRILVIALLCVHIGPEMIHSPVHRRGGPLFFALSLIPLFVLMAWLRANERRHALRGPESLVNPSSESVSSM